MGNFSPVKQRRVFPPASPAVLSTIALAEVEALREGWALPAVALREGWDKGKTTSTSEQVLAK